MKKLISIILLCVSVLCSCDKDPILESASFLDVGDTLRLVKGETYQLQLALYPESHRGETQIEYGAFGGNRKIATVSEQGLISAMGIGTTYISADIFNYSTNRHGARIAITNVPSPEVVVVVEPTPEEYYRADYYGRNYVNLGLSVLWCSTNVGTDKIEGYGEQFAWGETIPYDPGRDYKFETGFSCTKYTEADGLLTLEKCDDAVAANDGWARTPTKYEWEELYNSSTRYVTEYNGIRGVVFTGLNGHQIFLPSPVNTYDGVWNSSSSSAASGEFGAYASSSVNIGRPDVCCWARRWEWETSSTLSEYCVRWFPYHFRGVVTPLI